MGLQINSEVSYGFFFFIFDFALLHKGKKGAISGIFVLWLQQQLGAGEVVVSTHSLEKYGPLYQ